MNKLSGLIIVTAVVFIAALLLPMRASAENKDKREFLIPVDSTAYDLYCYPTGGGHFYLPEGTETEFKILNGEYYYLLFDDMIGRFECNINIFFYDEDGTFIKKHNIRSLTNSYSIPQNFHSINSKVLKVKISDLTEKGRRNFKMVVAVPKEWVKGQPIEKQQ